MHKHTQTHPTHRGGAAIVEFAFVFPVLLTFVLGTVDVGRMFYVRQGLEYATEEAARYYTLNPSTASSSITTQLRNKMPGGMGPSVSVAYAKKNQTHPTHRVTCTTITATYSFSFAGGYLGIGSKTLRATAEAVRYI